MQTLSTIDASINDSLLRELAFPSLGIISNIYVIEMAMTNVATLKHELKLKPPQMEPSEKVNKEQRLRWDRTVRAENNTVEYFTLFVPCVFISSIVGYELIGKWAPRIVGVLALANAFFRYQKPDDFECVVYTFDKKKYVKGYTKASEQRRSPFLKSYYVTKSLFFFSMMVSTLVIGKQLYGYKNEEEYLSNMISYLHDCLVFFFTMTTFSCNVSQIMQPLNPYCSFISLSM
ncbi:hypothetical protein RFI_13635 [Reticulomyxa filosa]|uniref:Uncharacterized protein n=1 Tax=Reticulomyxa filosa TaxID=46433 RepID=X6NDX1_RETFI|nr:hypothetical protein RFI_13635 [Reticulomyxa filosa]|eukprot:ETO23542.1 hypothetical protein RFI_13635 [Reticulomyxa filosa]